MKKTEEHKYDDIIDLPHHVSKTRAKMSLRERAAQFSPFAALTGHGDAVKETARLTQKKVELGEGDIEILNEKIDFLKSVINDKPYIKVAYFAKDPKKSGGAYLIYEGKLKRIDGYKRTLVFVSGKEIPLDDIEEISEPESTDDG